ncbi:glycoside hydrolase family 88/105 protein [Yoonia maritima]|uniref:glycoside hydrolase family 88/105 protein n=1 Tax=Yoonia maritima TaxID=1435347 RepID=UPI000D0E8FBA|nr:glycoside hydrolase family 88 protein [Yoonia maritima]
MLSDYFDAYARDHKYYKGGSWCYEDGLVYRALEAMHQATGEDRWLDHLKRLVDGQLTDASLPVGYDPSEYNIDHILSGRALVYLHAQTGDPKYMIAADYLALQLKHHPRTKSGVYWHKLRYPWQIWLDGLYMGPTFQVGYAQAIGDQAMVQDSLTQIATALNTNRDAKSGLFAHAYDEARMQPWADKKTGHSAAFWSRAIGWVAMALVDVAEVVSEQEFAPLHQDTVALLEKIYELRKPDGLWLQVIDRPDLGQNYQESSASAMFVYALVKASRIGILPANYDDLVDTLIDQTVRQRPDGQLEMFDMCWVAGLGPFEGRYRDGSAEYYVSEKICSDDPKGVSPLITAYALSLEIKKERAVG